MRWSKFPRSRKKRNVFLFKKYLSLSPFFRFFAFLNGSFFYFLFLSGLVIPFSPFFSAFSSFHLSKTLFGSLMGPNLAFLGRVVNGNLSKPVQCRSTNRSSPFLESFLVFLQPGFLVIRKNGSQKRPQYLKGIHSLAFSEILQLSPTST